MRRRSALLCLLAATACGGGAGGRDAAVVMATERDAGGIALDAGVASPDAAGPIDATEDAAAGDALAGAPDAAGRDAASPDAAAGPDAGLLGRPARVLLFSKTAGFRHSSIPAALDAIAAAGRTRGWTVDRTEDAAQINAQNLARYDAVAWVMTTGDVLDAAEQAAFEAWVRSGKGYAGVHSAADTEYDWPFYGELAGAYFENHPPGTSPARYLVTDRSHPATRGLPARWMHTDEHYNFRASPRGRAHVIMSLDERSYSGGAMPADHPIAWCKQIGRGRSFYTGVGHPDGAWTEAELVAHVVGGISWAAGESEGDCTASVDSAFEKEVLQRFSVGEQPMHLAAAPDGRVFYALRNGELRVYDPTDGMIATAGRLDVTSNLEDGLLGIALDPGFASNRWLYAYWSPRTISPPANVLSRFTMAGNTLMTATEVRLLTIPTQRNECCHSGGGMELDPDGNLVIGIGDNTNPFDSSGFAPIDERAGRSAWDAQRTAGNTNDLRGKIIRIRPTAAGGYTIPPGNLFAGDATHRPEIYAMGVRNPFRLAVDPGSGDVWFGDVGPDAQADGARGPKGYDELDLIRRNVPGNYGWPYCLGNDRPYAGHDFATGVTGAYFDCANPSNRSPNNTGDPSLPAAVSALLWYPYDASPEHPELGTGGRTAAAGLFYRYDASSTAPYKLPRYFDGTLFFMEWTRDYFREVKLDASGEVLAIVPVWSSFQWLHPVDAAIAADGSVYVLEFGTDFDGTGARFSRIRHSGGAQVPACVASATPASGALPLSVSFSSAGSMDPNGDPLSFAWDFESDGTTDSTAPSPTFVYRTAGNPVAKLTLADDQGHASFCTVPISAGNTAPEVVVEVPPAGGVYAWGDTIRYRVRASDADEPGRGTCARVEATPGLGHNDHVHDGLTQMGCTGSFAATLAENDVEKLFYVLKASYTDGGATGVRPITTVVNQRLQPSKRQSEHFDENHGTVVEATGDAMGGGQNLGFIDDGDWVRYDGYDLGNLQTLTLRAASAGAGGFADVRIGSPTGRVIATAQITVNGQWQVYRDVTVPIGDTNQSFTVDLGAVRAVQQIVLDATASANDYPRGWAVYASPDGASFGVPYAPIAAGAGSGPVTRIRLAAPVEARALRIVQTGAAPSWWWSIHELELRDASDTLIPRAGWRASASVSGEDPARAIDGDPATRWTSGEPMRPGKVDLYFTFRGATAGATGLFNLNWFTFGGRGIGAPN